MVSLVTNGLLDQKMKKEKQKEEESVDQQKDLIIQFFEFLCEKMVKPNVMPIECRLFISIYKRVKKYDRVYFLNYMCSIFFYFLHPSSSPLTTKKFEFVIWSLALSSDNISTRKIASQNILFSIDVNRLVPVSSSVTSSLAILPQDAEVYKKKIKDFYKRISDEIMELISNSKNSGANKTDSTTSHLQSSDSQPSSVDTKITPQDVSKVAPSVTVVTSALSSSCIFPVNTVSSSLSSSPPQSSLSPYTSSLSISAPSLSLTSPFVSSYHRTAAALQLVYASLSRFDLFLPPSERFSILRYGVAVPVNVNVTLADGFLL
jgi:hypothetical protein